MTSSSSSSSTISQLPRGATTVISLLKPQFNLPIVATGTDALAHAIPPKRKRPKRKNPPKDPNDTAEEDFSQKLYRDFLVTLTNPVDSASCPPSSATTASTSNSVDLMGQVPNVAVGNNEDDDEDDDDFVEEEGGGDDLDYEADTNTWSISKREVSSLLQEGTEAHFFYPSSTTTNNNGNIITTMNNNNNNVNNLNAAATTTTAAISSNNSSMCDSQQIVGREAQDPSQQPIMFDYKLRNVPQYYPQNYTAQPHQYGQMQFQAQHQNQIHKVPHNNTQKPLFTNDQLRELRTQLMNHVQLLLQVIMLQAEDFLGGNIRRDQIYPFCKMLDELYKCFKVSYDYKTVFFFCITGQGPTPSDNVSTLFNIPQIDKVPQFIQYVRDSPTIEKTELDRLMGMMYSNFSSELRYRMTNITQRTTWLPSEDMLLLIGLEMYEKDWDTIRTKLLPIHTKEQIAAHYKNKTSRRAGDNLIKQLALEAPFTDAEKVEVMLGVKSFGEQWDIISTQFLPHRTPKSIERYYKKLRLDTIKHVFSLMEHERTTLPSEGLNNSTSTSRGQMPLVISLQSQQEQEQEQEQEQQQQQQKYTRRDEESAAMALVSIPRNTTSHLPPPSMLIPSAKELSGTLSSSQQTLSFMRIGIDGIPGAPEDIISEDEDVDDDDDDDNNNNNGQ